MLCCVRCVLCDQLYSILTFDYGQNVFDSTELLFEFYGKCSQVRFSKYSLVREVYITHCILQFRNSPFFSSSLIHNLPSFPQLFHQPPNTSSPTPLLPCFSPSRFELTLALPLTCLLVRVGLIASINGKPFGATLRS